MVHFKKAAAILTVVILIVAMAPPGRVSAEIGSTNSEANFSNSFTLGADSSDMIIGGGRTAKSDQGQYWINDLGQIMFDDDLLISGRNSCLNVIDNTVWYVRQDEGHTRILQFSWTTGEEKEIVSLGAANIREMYVSNGTDFYLLLDDGITVYHSDHDLYEELLLSDKILSFVPTAYGIVYATGSLFHYDIHAAEKVVETDVDGYYVDFDLNGGSLVFTKNGDTYQASLQSVFDGDCVVMDFVGYETVVAQELFSDLQDPDGDFASGAQNNRRGTAVSQTTANRKTLSKGVQNIVKRAYQMANIQWTPLANITGWNGEMTYYAGTTYTGLPYGQPVTTSDHVGSYVPWQTSLSDFISMVYDPNSKMYTSKATYEAVAPYYSCDCSAFVSWAWNLSSRTTTSYIPGYATLVSTETYTGLQVGDCFCKPKNHVVLVTDITYDDNGVINGVEISESTVNPATNYCCQKTWYGEGYSYPLTTLQTKYISAGYGLYRSHTRDAAGYTHCCVVPLEGDSCELCGVSSYTSCPTYATIQFPADTPIYRSPEAGAEQTGTAYADRKLIINAYATVDGEIWYKLEVSGWVKAADSIFVGYQKTAQLTDEYLPTGRLVYGNVFPLEGYLSASNPITKVQGMISTADGVQEQIKTVRLSNEMSYALKKSTIDNAMVFNTLSVGDHVLRIEVTETASCAGQPTVELITDFDSPFTIYSAPVERTAKAHGIDVSAHQGTIEWDTVAPNIDFAIIRCGYGDDLTNQDDTMWTRNADACTRLGIPFGVYIYSYALSDEQALSEAQHVIRLLEGYNPSLPVYLDLEDKNTTATLTNAEILRHTEIFCDAVEAAGYTPGVYSSRSWWSNKLASGAYNRWNRWLAQFSDSISYVGEYNIWQHSDSGTVPGVSGGVDMDYLYDDLPLTPQPHEHTYESSTTEPASCTEAGRMTFTCSICGYEYMKEICALGHVYDDWITTRKPTCTEAGLQRSTCARCRDIQYREVPATGHSFQNGICAACGSSDPNLAKGDINGDGVVTSADAVLLARYLVDLISFSDYQRNAADMNGDGFVTSEDSALIAKLLVS